MPTCAELRKQLNNSNIAFADIDVEKSGELDLMTQTMEIPGYPSVWVAILKCMELIFRW